MTVPALGEGLEAPGGPLVKFCDGIPTAGVEASPGAPAGVVAKGEVLLAGTVPNAEAGADGTGRAAGLTVVESTHPEQIACPVGGPEHKKDP